MLTWLHWYWPAIAWTIACCACLAGFVVGRRFYEDDLGAVRLEYSILVNTCDRWESRARAAEKELAKQQQLTTSQTAKEDGSASRT